MLFCAALYYAVFLVLCFVFCYILNRKWITPLWSVVQVITAGEFEYAVNRIYLAKIRPASWLGGYSF
jgi:hypothetical protein